MSCSEGYISVKILRFKTSVVHEVIIGVPVLISRLLTFGLLLDAGQVVSDLYSQH